MGKTYDREFEVKGKETIRVRDLEAIPVDTEAWSTLETDEFTSLCPFSGLPDFAKLTIRYNPSGKALEHKSFKLYLASFRNVGILQEEAVEQIYRDLSNLLKPFALTVRAEFKARGGMSNIVER
ncbi:MAG: preQ(1) synthase [Deltaproteobacteria bacterium]|nr:MAG: preQ(1) synthase [Deltaproteobacteria bacterium]